MTSPISVENNQYSILITKYECQLWPHGPALTASSFIITGPVSSQLKLVNILPQNLESYDTTTHTKGYNHIGGNEKIGFWGYQMIIHQTGERERVRLWVCYNLLENLNNMGVCSPALGEQK